MIRFVNKLERIITNVVLASGAIFFAISPCLIMEYCPRYEALGWVAVIPAIACALILVDYNAWWGDLGEQMSNIFRDEFNK